LFSGRLRKAPPGTRRTWPLSTDALASPFSNPRRMSPAELRVPRPEAFIPIEGHYLQQSKIRTCYKYITATKK